MYTDENEPSASTSSHATSKAAKTAVRTVCSTLPSWPSPSPKTVLPRTSSLKRKRCLTSSQRWSVRGFQDNGDPDATKGMYVGRPRFVDGPHRACSNHQRQTEFSFKLFWDIFPNAVVLSPSACLFSTGPSSSRHHGHPASSRVQGGGHRRFTNALRCVLTLGLIGWTNYEVMTLRSSS